MILAISEKKIKLAIIKLPQFYGIKIRLAKKKKNRSIPISISSAHDLQCLNEKILILKSTRNTKHILFQNFKM